MPRRRMIDPDIWHDPWFGHLEPLEQVFWIGIVSNADDYGRILADPIYLRSRIFVYRDITIEEVNRIVQKFQDTNSNFIMYNQNGTQCIYLKRWSDYQNIAHPTPSKLPPPEHITNDSRNIQESITNGSSQLVSIVNKDIDSKESPHESITNESGINQEKDNGEVFSLYESNVGMLTPIIADQIKDAITTYSNGWVKDAIAEAVKREKRNWKYIDGILRGWKREGRGQKNTGDYDIRRKYHRVN